MSVGVAIQKLRELIGEILSYPAGDQARGVLASEPANQYALHEALPLQVAQGSLQRVSLAGLGAPVGAEQKHAVGAGVASYVLQELEARVVSPVEVVEQEGNGRGLGDSLQEARHRPEQPLLLLLLGLPPVVRGIPPGWSGSSRITYGQRVGNSERTGSGVAACSDDSASRNG